MNIGTRVIDASQPAVIGIYQGQCTTGGKPYARVKFGHKVVSVPIDRVRPVVERGPKPVTPADFQAIKDRYGYSEDDVRRIAKGNRVTLRIAVDDLLECDEGCDCSACEENL